MSICAIVDANGNVVSTVMADPSTDQPPAGCTLVSVPTGASVDSTWSYSTAQGFFLSTAAQAVADAKTKLPPVPTWNDGAQPFTDTTPASQVISVCGTRITELQAIRGHANYNPTSCPAYNWAVANLTGSDTCTTFCNLIATKYRAGTVTTPWLADFLYINANLLPTDLLMLLVNLLPPAWQRLAIRYCNANGIATA